MMRNAAPPVKLCCPYCDKTVLLVPDRQAAELLRSTAQRLICGDRFCKASLMSRSLRVIHSA